MRRINIETGEIKDYVSIMDATRDGFNSSRITSCCRGNSAFHKGFFWEYLDENKRKSYNRKPITKKGPKKSVVKIDLETGNILERYCPLKTVKKDGFNPHRVIECCKKRRDTYAGFRWEYVL